MEVPIVQYLLEFLDKNICIIIKEFDDARYFGIGNEIQFYHSNFDSEINEIKWIASGWNFPLWHRGDCIIKINKFHHEANNFRYLIAAYGIFDRETFKKFTRPEINYKKVTLDPLKAYVYINLRTIETSLHYVIDGSIIETLNVIESI